MNNKILNIKTWGFFKILKQILKNVVIFQTVCDSKEKRRILALIRK
jgi:hypothetical protein